MKHPNVPGMKLVVSGAVVDATQQEAETQDQNTLWGEPAVHGEFLAPQSEPGRR